MQEARSIVVPDTDIADSLERRVDAYLRSTHSMYIVEEIENNTLQALLDELGQAEKELETARARVARLKLAVADAEFDRAARE